MQWGAFEWEFTGEQGLGVSICIADFLSYLGVASRLVREGGAQEIGFILVMKGEVYRRVIGYEVTTYCKE